MSIDNATRQALINEIVKMEMRIDDFRKAEDSLISALDKIKDITFEENTKTCIICHADFPENYNVCPYDDVRLTYIHDDDDAQAEHADREIKAMREDV